MNFNSSTDWDLNFFLLELKFTIIISTVEEWRNGKAKKSSFFESTFPSPVPSFVGSMSPLDFEEEMYFNYRFINILVLERRGRKKTVVFLFFDLELLWSDWNGTSNGQTSNALSKIKFKWFISEKPNLTLPNYHIRCPKLVLNLIART